MTSLDNLSTLFVAISSIGVCIILSLVYRVIYIIYFHPLAHIPGPKLAAASYLYQTYFSLVSGSKFYIQIQKLHEEYGPVIRITPDETHLSDTANYDTIYHVGTKYLKGPFYESFSLGNSTFSTRNSEIHRIRRGALNPFFSRRRVLETEDLVQSKTEKLCEIAQKKFVNGQAIDLHHAFRAISIDIMTEYALAECLNLLDHPDLGAKFFAVFRKLGPSLWLGQQWPALHEFLMSLPPMIASAMNSAVGDMLRLQEDCRQQCLAVKKAVDGGFVSHSRASVFHALLTPEDKDERYVVPTVNELKDEATAFFGAAADTTGSAMTVATHHIVSNPKIQGRLVEELEQAFPDPNTMLEYSDLEQLPYLSAVIKEGLRLSYGVPGRLQRVVPDGGATFNNVFLPAGSYVSMSSWICHQDQRYFPNPLKYNPDRWLDDVSEARRIEHGFVSFSRGTRQCVGMPLAYCELYVTLGTLFRRFPFLKGNNLKPEDMVMDDYMGGHYPADAPKLHVTSPVFGSSATPAHSRP